MNPTDDLIKRIGEVVDEKIRQQVEPINHRLDKIEKAQKKQGKAIKQVQETLDVAIDMFDKGDIRLYKRVTRIEDHLGLPKFE